MWFLTFQNFIELLKFLLTEPQLICRDLNPLYDVTIQRDYKEKYYMKLMPLGQKYAEVSKILKLKKATNSTANLFKLYLPNL